MSYTYHPDGTLELTYNYDSTIQDKTLSFTFLPGVYGEFFATPPTMFDIICQPDNNLPAVYYDEATYDKV